jgi:hypothetical protein
MANEVVVLVLVHLTIPEYCGACLSLEMPSACLAAMRVPLLQVDKSSAW